MSISKLNGKDGALDVHIWSPLDQVESSALDQLKNVAKLPWAFHHVAVMADCHAGKGCTVGSVIAMKGALSPATVGVDIGCGMMAVKTSLKASDLPDNLEPLRSAIEAAIPVGFNYHDKPVIKYSHNAFTKLGKLTNELHDTYKVLNPYVDKLEAKAFNQLGTLGGGNHFIEICLDEGFVDCGDPKCDEWHQGCREPNVWLMLHSGSRNIGKELAEIYISTASVLSHNQALPDRDLAVFLAGTPIMAEYRINLFWAQQYALVNRLTMMFLLKQAIIDNIAFDVEFEEAISCHHNYVSEEFHYGKEVFITRKGAISARVGELGIIPGSMGDSSYIVEGLGNPESFNSASHGAGRVMSRGKAKKSFTVEDLARQTEGVCCKKDSSVLDEIPGAYKRIDQVMENQKDLVKIVTKLKQVLCVKG